MTREVLTRAQYLEVLNESLRHHPEWQPGMAFVFLPLGSSAKRAKEIGFTGPPEAWRIFNQIQSVAVELCEVRKSANW